jgi:alpha-tubulin suppressor-like RCC1 family protein
MTRFLASCVFVLVALACSEPTATNVEIRPGQFVSVAAGRWHACAIDTIGRGWCWGDNSYGQSASATQACIGCRVAPSPIETDLRFTTISTGSTHTCGIVADGTAYCWGDNSFGQLGYSTSVDCVTGHPCSVTPTVVSGGHLFKTITGGAYGTCGITVNDVLKCWGYQGFSNAINLASPTTVRLSATGDSVWSLVGHTDGGLNGCGLANGGVAACWGQNFYGQLGIGAINNTRSNPVAIVLDAVVKSISSGSGFTCALTSIGDAYCWGLSVRGALALGADAASSPCNVSAPDLCFPSPLKVIGGRKFSQLTVGYEHVCGLDIESGDAYCWGSNTYQAIGAQSLGNTPVAPSPFAAANGTKYTSLSAGRQFTCGVMLDRNISCWGYNGFGQLGQESGLIYTFLPIIVAPNSTH